jgi:hypothetical protein
MIENSYDTIQIPGQMSIQEFLDEDLPESLFAVSKIFAQARKEMNTAELKAFTFALTHIKFKDPNASNKIRLDKKTLANIVGIDSNCTDLSQHLKRSLKDLPKHSHFIIENESADENDENAFEMESGITITSLRFYRNYVVMTFNPDYMPLFAGLDKDYITMWSGDIFRMQSERSITFYEQLRLYSDTSQLMCKHGFGVKAIKDLFDIPKDGKGSYMRPDGHFNRPAFEKKVLDPLVEDLSKCKMIQLVANEDGSFYKKVKKGNRVLGYDFCWTITDRPSIGTATEMAEVKQAFKENDPQKMKLMKDIITGEKKANQKKAKSKKGLKNFELDGNIDADALTKAMLNKNNKEG